MADVIQSHSDLEGQLQEQLHFLEKSAQDFDGGDESEAKRMAVTLRILLHDPERGRGMSLLSQLGLKNEAFYDTAAPQDRFNPFSHSGLVVAVMDFKNAVRWFAPLDDVTVGIRQVAFDEWWSAGVFVDHQRRTLTRAELIRTMADQDGGAHVDPKLDAKYADLSRHNSMQMFSGPQQKPLPMAGPERAAVRQIAHEVLKTLKPGYTKAPSYPKDSLIIGGLELVPVEQAEAMKHTGRNEPCPCGSGLKFKRCHGPAIKR